VDLHLLPNLVYIAVFQPAMTECHYLDCWLSGFNESAHACKQGRDETDRLYYYFDDDYWEL